MLAEESTIQLVAPPDLWPTKRWDAPVREKRAGVNPAPRDDDSLSPLPRQFAPLLAEVLAGVRSEQQLTPWLSKRATIHAHRLMPLFRSGHQPKILRIITSRPTQDVIEMTMIAVLGPRPRPHALAIRLERTARPEHWQCTDIESA